MSNMSISIKRIYDDPSELDGYRVLVDRLWPRGVSKERAALDMWLKDVAPSSSLRTWFGHKPENFTEFKARYEVELENNPAVAQLKSEIKKHEVVTLLYGAHDPIVNHAQVLLEYLSRN
jgi:DNA-3-methyladenine glycosylase